MRDGAEAGLHRIDAILAGGQLTGCHFAYSARGVDRNRLALQPRRVAHLVEEPREAAAEGA
jgi:predicted RNA polymerase sigma factor